VDKFAVCNEIFFPFDLFLKLTLFFSLKKKKVNSSIMGYFSPPIIIWYGATKSALNKFTHDLYYVASKHNVRVNLLLPGYVSTNMTNNQPNMVPVSYFVKIVKKQLEDNVFCITYPFYQSLFCYILSTLPQRVAHLATDIMTVKSHDLE
jgi:hypothetical protein